LTFPTNDVTRRSADSSARVTESTLEVVDWAGSLGRVVLGANSQHAARRGFEATRDGASRAVHRTREALKTTGYGQSLTRTIASLGLLRPRRGHYYSPLPSLKEVTRDRARIFDRSLHEPSGVDVNDAGQRMLLEELAAFYPDHPFTERPGAGNRYHLENSWFGAADGLFLHLMLRRAQPRRVIEVGSGFSSLVMLDTSERFFDGTIQLTFIEPNAERLLSRLRPGDERRAEILESAVQEVDLSVFERLSAGDILFIDSSHVAKVGSDVNHLLFSVLPRVAPGVLIHFHDVTYPFEYPEEWIHYGFAWNEAYLLRAFLQYNSDFRIVLWNSYVARFHADFLRARMPRCAESVSFGVGGSLWLERRRR
jgi:predicted O-methyltransferase YrrM